MKHSKLWIIPLLLVMAGLLLLLQSGVLTQSVTAGEDSGAKLIATIDGQDFRLRDLSLYGGDSEEGRLNAVMQELLYREALEQGFTPHREQVAADLSLLRSVLSADEANNEQIMRELAAIYGPGLSEDEYWQAYEDELVKLELGQQLYNSLQAAYEQNGGDLAADFMEVYGQSLLDKYNVVMK